jgi:nicotinamide-nucleotide amidase
LGVDGALLETQGAVNAEVATQMALGALKMLGGTLAISTTGVAGPGKGENDPEVGTVFIGFAGEGVSAGATAHHFDGNRQAVVEQATAQALNILESLL